MRFQLTLCLLLLCTASVAMAQNAKDPSLQPVTRKALQKLIATTPLTSKLHGRLIGRAYASKLTGAAYVEYTNLWRKQQKDAHANLWRGSTAYLYWWQASYPSAGIRLSGEQKSRLWQTARTCLHDAVELKPDLAAANSTYGAFLSTQPEGAQKGLKLMRRAIELDPKSAGTWRTLGEALINPYSKSYNPVEGEKALLKAAQLSPLYAAPRSALTRLYVEQKRYKEAQRQLQAYTRLVSAKDAAATVRFFKPQIDKGLKNS